MAASIIKKLQRRKDKIFNTVKDLEDILSSLGDSLKAGEIATLNLYVNDIKPMYAEVEKINDDLFEENIDIAHEVRDFKRKYMDVLGKAQGLLNSVTPTLNAVTHPASTETPPVKLPAVEIPIFNGNYEKWTTFKDSFTALIHNNKGLSNIQKFHYLQSALRGESASILKCLTLSEEGYVIAWDRLQKRYQNERFIVKKHVNTLLNLPEMKKGDHVSLRHLIDTVSVTLSSLKALKRPADQWDDILIEIVSTKLDANLRKEWEGETCDKIPNYEELEKFLTAKCKQLEAIKNTVFTAKEINTHEKVKVYQINTNERKCLHCKGDHSIYKCFKFSKMSVSERIAAAKQNQLCFNCLGKNHTTKNCSSTTCRKCDQHHHTLLHPTQEPMQTVPTNRESVPKTSSVNFAYSPSKVLLSTCQVIIEDNCGRKQTVRILLDSGAQANLITDSCATRLGLRRVKTNVPIVGVGGKYKSLSHVVSTNLSSRLSRFKLSISALVIETITSKTPSGTIDFDMSKIPFDIQLADPTFYEPQEIDMLIGNAHYNDILIDGRLKVNALSFFNTHFGWIIYGELPYKSEVCQQDRAIVSLVGLNDLMSKFWELESHKEESLTPAEGRCEDHFRTNTKRDETGRFIVALPFKENPCGLGNSSALAKRRFFALERRLIKSVDTYAQYRAFMQEYEDLGHMKKTSGDVSDGYYLPHHCVVKQSSLTTKLRVVFNASAPSSTGHSLNDILMVGPTIQDDLFSILARMRCWKYVVTADIANMYRQVKVRDEDVKFQRIWWRYHPEDTLQSYELTTVTYGTSSAAYLAIRALRELAYQSRCQYPIGSERCLSDFYVDDLITGANTLSDLKQVRDEINSLLNCGGFELKKWASNNVKLFENFKTECNDGVTILTRESEQTDSVTTLGTVWNTVADILMYKCNIQPSRHIYTKRIVLSELSRVYDPLGLIGPIIITGKIFIQDLWKIKCGWDDALPETFTQRWLEYANNLKDVSTISIPRLVIESENCHLELHGFADASEHAYGACIYAVGINNDIPVFSNLICAKSRVSPVKTTSIPRLELCAAVLLAELCQRLRKAFNHLESKCYFYSDSTITLSWIKADSKRFKTFVANRVGEIQKITKAEDWMHVSTKDNPADLISRGATASSLRDNELWWRGPDFLLMKKIKPNFIPDESLLEVKCNVINTTIDSFILPECCTFEKTIRVIAYVIRFKDYLIKRAEIHKEHLTISELHSARIVLLKNLQSLIFNRELELLRQGSCVTKNSKLVKLNPFLDSNGLIRVGGRLAYSELSCDRRFPIVLPANHRLTKLIVRSTHESNLHIGTQGTLAALRLKYWPLNSRRLVRGVLRSCVRCIRAKPQFQAPLMSALPKIRTQQTRAFLNCGVDYSGPFIIKEGSRKSKKTHMFAFFRRGCPIEIISDNGTNFIGARNHLRELGFFLRNTDNVNILTNKLSQHQIKWTFIPPRAPHFGGLWEAAVKSVKTHLHRVAGKALLTVEEMTTLLTQIEAVLNSRPLCPLTDDPNDLCALTPAHFLIGDVLTAPLDPDLTDTPINRLSRWQMIQKLRQHIWKRWSREYLSELHARGKWTQNDSQFKVGQLVIIKEDNIPPLNWQLGRIEELNTGSDGIARSATIRTSTTKIVRPIIKLCQLLRE